MNQFAHIPVLTREVIEYLDIKPGNKYIDATLGGGGHTEAIIQHGGIVLGIDQDSDAIRFVTENSKSEILNHKLTVAKGNFRDIEKIAQVNKFVTVSGILFDLGFSSHQMDTSDRGFSIKRNAPLDMRMDANSDITAAHIISSYPKERLIEIFQKYGEEDQAEAAAEQITKARRSKKIETTGQLLSVLALTLKKPGTIHPATKIFQALRIEVNAELDSLKLGLAGALTITAPEAHIIVISFHSLEDRITKRYFSDWEHKGLGKVLTKKPITASFTEVRSNPRARSAKMRVFEKGS